MERFAKQPGHMVVEVLHSFGSVEEVEIQSGEALTEISKRFMGGALLDTVDLRDGRVMLVDDMGVSKRLPVNEPASKYYRSICKPEAVAAGLCNIYGTAVVVWDDDFGQEE